MGNRNNEQANMTTDEIMEEEVKFFENPLKWIGSTAEDVWDWTKEVVEDAALTYMQTKDMERQSSEALGKVIADTSVKVAGEVKKWWDGEYNDGWEENMRKQYPNGYPSGYGTYGPDYYEKYLESKNEPIYYGRYSKMIADANRKRYDEVSYKDDELEEIETPYPNYNYGYFIKNVQGKTLAETLDEYYDKALQKYEEQIEKGVEDPSKVYYFNSSASIAKGFGIDFGSTFLVDLENDFSAMYEFKGIGGSFGLENLSPIPFSFSLNSGEVDNFDGNPFSYEDWFLDVNGGLIKNDYYSKSVFDKKDYNHKINQEGEGIGGMGLSGFLNNYDIAGLKYYNKDTEKNNDLQHQKYIKGIGNEEYEYLKKYFGGNIKNTDNAILHASAYDLKGMVNKMIAEEQKNIINLAKKNTASSPEEVSRIINARQSLDAISKANTNEVSSTIRKTNTTNSAYQGTVADSVEEAYYTMQDNIEKMKKEQEEKEAADAAKRREKAQADMLRRQQEALRITPAKSTTGTVSMMRQKM